MSNSVVHFELPADDVSRAQTFYRDTFGWQINPIPEMDYTGLETAPVDENQMPTQPGTINGGLSTRQGPLMSPVVTIGVDDIDAALETVERNGGKTVHGKFQVGDMGFAAYFADTEGSTVGLWQNA